LTPQAALRVLERELKVNDGAENEEDREQALDTLWEYVLLNGC
jgi:hypothetical protein